MKGQLHIFDDEDTLIESLARAWSALAEIAVRERGSFQVALAGGSTPKRFYQRLAQADLRDSLPWAQTQIYFGDERCVAQHHADSNFHMASEALLTRVPVPETQIHPMYDAALSAGENARRYASLLQNNLPLAANGQPVFDLVLLGMGTDGHTASLFPGSDILQESQQPVAAQFVEALQAWRISLTFPAINAARQVFFLVAGKGKADILHTIAQSESAETYPVQRVQPAGELHWYLDRAAARRLETEGHL
jgi:6-phosphogluconolactonase